MTKRKIGMWLYQNGGGIIIQNKLISMLRDREIDVINNINLRDAISKDGYIIHKDTYLDELDLFFSYNAGEQTQYQTYLYKALSRIIPTINTYEAFELTEDKFQTTFILNKYGIKTANYKLCHCEDTHKLQSIIRQWGKMVYKPTDCWGGVGLTKIENHSTLDMLIPFLNNINSKYFYVEKFVNYDNTDYRVDIVDGKYVSCYGRKASKDDWRTNVTSGGQIFLREPNDQVINLAIKAAQITGADIAGVDIIYDRELEEYIVLEVNGIPAFATPEQEKMGLNFNNKKVELITELIDKKTKDNYKEAV